MNKTLVTLAVALCCGFAGSASAAMSKDEYKSQKDRIEADYKAAKAKCKPLKGDEQKACTKDAKAAHEKAEADIKRAKADMKTASKKS